MGKPRILVVDDLRVFDQFVGDVTYYRTTAEALDSRFWYERWDEVWWDHDMGMDTVRPVVNAMESDWHHDNDLLWNIQMHNIVTDSPSGRLWLSQCFERWSVPYRVMSGKVPFRMVWDSGF